MTAKAVNPIDTCLFGCSNVRSHVDENCKLNWKSIARVAVAVELSMHIALRVLDVCVHLGAQ